MGRNALEAFASHRLLLLNAMATKLSIHKVDSLILLHYSVAPVNKFQVYRILQCVVVPILNRVKLDNKDVGKPVLTRQYRLLAGRE
jgi:hypothetical protein